MDNPNSFFSTLSMDELHRLVLAREGPAEQDVFRALGSPSGIASKFTKILHVADISCAGFSFANSTLVVGLTTELDVVRRHLELCGNVFSYIVLHAAKVPRRISDYPSMTTDRRIHFQSYAALIAPFVLPEIELKIYIDAFDPQIVEIFTKKFGKSIKEVKIYAISAPFTLECFNLPPSLRSFTFTGKNLHKLDPLWEVVGDNLEKVRIVSRDDIGWKSCIGRLKTYCRKLSSIYLKGPFNETGVQKDDISELLCSYGKQLEYADLSGLGTESCIRIAKECINLRCSITIYMDITFESDGFTQLSALHNRVRSVEFEVEEPFRIDWSKLSYAMKSCGSIEEMKIRDYEVGNDSVIPHELIRAVFPKPERLLENFSIEDPLWGRPDSFVHIARSTGKLKQLNLNVLFPIHPTAFDSICKANTQLEVICIMESEPPAAENVPEEETRQLVTELVEATAPCKSLKHFSLRFRARNRPEEVFMRDIQVPFKTRLVEFEATFIE